MSMFTPAARLEVQRRLGDSWRDLADFLNVPPYRQRQWLPGQEPRSLWEWLSERGRLAELPGALRTIGRDDLAPLLTVRPAVAPHPRGSGESARHIAALPPPEAATALAALPSWPTAAVDVLGTLPPRTAGDLLLAVGATAGTGIGRLHMLLAAMQPSLVARIVDAQPPQDAAHLIVRLDPARGAAVLTLLVPEHAAAVLKRLGPALLGSLTGIPGTAIAEPSPLHLVAGRAKAAEYLARMPEETAARLRAAMRPGPG